MKKLISILITVCLVICLNTTVLAETTAFFEYVKDEDSDIFGPKAGIDWKISNRWGLTLSRQLDDEVTYFEVRSTLSNQILSLALYHETSISKDSNGLRINTFSPLYDKLWFDSSASYTCYSTHLTEPGNLDYQLLKVVCGLQYQLNGKLLAVTSWEWTDYQYRQNPATPTSNPDYNELRLTAGLVFQFNKSFYIKGQYSWLHTICRDPEVNAVWGGISDKVTIYTNYDYQNYSFYLEYPFPVRNNTVKLGIAYHF